MLRQLLGLSLGYDLLENGGKEERSQKKCCAAEKLSSRSSPLCQLKKCREGDLHFLVWSQDCQLKKCRVISTCLASGRRNCCGTCPVTCLCQLWKMEIVSSLVELDLSVAFLPQPKLNIDWNLSLFLWIPFGMKELHCTSEFFREFLQIISYIEKLLLVLYQ